MSDSRMLTYSTSQLLSKLGANQIRAPEKGLDYPLQQQGENSDTVFIDNPYITTNVAESKDKSVTPDGLLYLPGNPISGYQISIQLKLFENSHGSIHRATYGSDKTVVVKILEYNHENLRYCENERSIQQLLAQSKNSHVFASCLGFYKSNTSYNIVMEYAAHGDLHKYIFSDEYQKSNWDDVFDIVKQIIFTVYALHAENIVHRDLKPHNILITAMQPIKIKLADFGIARVNVNYKFSNQGTRGYRAPELRTNDAIKSNQEDVNKKMDIFSLGMLVYKMVYKKLNIANAYFQHFNHQDRQIFLDANQRPEIPPNCDERIAELIRLCWQQDPDARPDAETLMQRYVVKQSANSPTSTLKK